jgi:poly(3-hydroxybutyrate) depolymerase
MKTRFTLLLSLAFLTFSPAQEPPADPTEWASERAPSPHLDEAQFRWWAPEDLKKIRGVLVLIPGRNGDARNAVNDAEWQELAREQEFALVGARLFKPDGAYQLDPDGKTTATIERAIAELGKANGHPEADKAPLAFWGMSAGANTANYFAAKNPRRVIAIASIKCPGGHGSPDRARTQIPILACVGKNDKADWVKSAMENYENGKQSRAVWTLALHPTEGHEGGASKPLAVAFLREVIPQRLGSTPSSSSGSPNLKSLSVQSGWLGDPETLEAAAANDFKGRKRNAIWLPGPGTAEAWRTYLQTKKGDTTPSAGAGEQQQ